MGTLFSGDCYILLETREAPKPTKADGSTAATASSSAAALGGREWRIFYWIGAKASLDKRACVAMHAVNLRNFLGTDGPTQREEQGDETGEFLSLFGGRQITVVEGSSGSTGFNIVDCKESFVRMYR